MKKTISITVGGILFHIEEDCFEHFKAYMTSVHQYFSSFEDAREILADIESRIAEILLARQKQFERQVVTAEDIDRVIATIGTVQDFSAQDAEDHEASEPKASQQPFTFEQPATTKLYRNRQGKILGGVLGGLANNLDLNPVWVRIGFLAFFFGLAWLPAIPTFLFLAYIALWIAMPAQDLPEKNNYRKLYRDGQNSVIGGVASGLAAYFKTDLVVFRVLFVVGIFAGGFGVLTYILLWMVMPKADTLKARMEMQGEPVTLEGVENFVRRTESPATPGKESVVSQVFLFPFRVLGQIFEALGPVFSALAKGIAYMFGALLMAVSLAVVLSLLWLLAVALFTPEYVLNKAWWSPIHIDDVSVEGLVRQVTFPMALGLGLLVFIPSLSALFLSIRLFVGRAFLPKIVNWSLLAIYVLALVFTLATWIPFGFKYSEEARRTTPLERIEGKVYKRMFLKTREVKDAQAWGHVKFELMGTSDSSIRLEKIVSARGLDYDEARAHVEKLTWGYQIQDSILYLDEAAVLPANTPYQMQTVKVRIYLPAGQHFQLDWEVERKNKTLMPYSTQNEFEGRIFVMTPHGIKYVNVENPEGFYIFNPQEHLNPLPYSKTWSPDEYSETLRYEQRKRKERRKSGRRDWDKDPEPSESDEPEEPTEAVAPREQASYLRGVSFQPSEYVGFFLPGFAVYHP